MSLSAGTKLGPYEIVSPLGKGGMGEVWRARDPRLGRDVAIKVSAAQFTDRFEREARAIAALNHPNICQIYDVGPNYLVMELIDGAQLAGPLPVEKAVAYAGLILDALDAAHRKGFTHRDLKPANILVTKQGGLKLLDFGLAKQQVTGLGPDDVTIQGAMTAEGQISGTLQYMSPEQLNGKEADARSDIFAFGCVLYEMLSGKKAFGGSTAASVIAAIMEREPEPLQAAPPLDRVIRKCLAKDPDERFQTARDLKYNLGLAIEPAAVVRTSGRQSRTAWAVAGVVGVVAAVAVGAMLTRGKVAVAQPVRFELPLPKDSSLAVASSISVSPDGRKVAFIAQSGGKGTVWVRALDSTEAHPLPASDPAAGGRNGPLIWSPDSRFLSFFSPENKMRRIPIDGGPPQTICDISVFTGGTWNEDGTILFSTRFSGLMRVSQSGGQPVPVTTLDGSRGEIEHEAPQFLPDGRHFLYVARTAKDDTSAIVLGSLESKSDSKETKRVVQGVARSRGNSFAWAPPGNGGGQGHILFVRQGVLMAQPVDASSLSPAGEAIPLAEHAVSVTVSANGVLAYTTVNAVGVGGQRQMRWRDRTGKLLGDAGAPAGMQDMVLSRDTNRAAVALDDGQGQGPSVWITDMARAARSRLSFDPGQQQFIAWSPDGSEVAYASGAAGRHDRILARRADGSGAARQLLTGLDILPRDWSADGKWLLYKETGAQTKNDLWVLPLESKGDAKPVPFLHSEYDEGDGRFSPDAHWIAYASNQQGRMEVFVQSFPPGQGKFQISTGGGGQPKWRRDGRELYYVAADGNLKAVDIKTAPRFEAGVPRALFKTPLSGENANSQYDVAPDGKRFLLLEPVATNEPAAGMEMPFTVVLNWQAGLKK